MQPRPKSQGKKPKEEEADAHNSGEGRGADRQPEWYGATVTVEIVDASFCYAGSEFGQCGPGAVNSKEATKGDCRKPNDPIVAHNGMLSCFFHGFSSCLFRSLRRPSATRRRVECGMMTSSMKPLLAATNGLAKRSSYSRVRSAISSDVLPRKMISTAPLAPITAISAVGQA